MPEKTMLGRFGSGIAETANEIGWDLVLCSSQMR